MSELMPQLGLILLLLVAPRVSFAEIDQSFAGHLKYQPTLEQHDAQSVRAQQGADRSLSHTLDARGLYELQSGNFAFESDLEVLGLFGSELDTQREVAAVGLRSNELLLRDQRRLLDLRVEIVDEEKAMAIGGFDRLLISYELQRLLFTFGRQAVSWGNGLSFSVLDVFNPFSPIEIDRDYKPGDDLFLLQALLPERRSVQLLALGRRDAAEDVTTESSSFAIRVTSPLEAFESDIEVIAASHFGQDFWGLGVNRSVLEGVLRFDISYSGAIEGENGLSFLLNYDRSWFVFEKNVYGFVEYFHSGYGEEQSELPLSEPLLERLERGELYTIGEDYLGTGLRIEWTPLTQSVSSYLANLNDASSFLQQRVEVDVLQDVQLTLGADLPLGGAGSEYGGLELALPDGRNVLLAASSRAYIRVAYYF